MSKIPAWYNSEKDKEEVQAWCLLHKPRMRTSVSDGKIRAQRVTCITEDTQAPKEAGEQFPVSWLELNIFISERVNPSQQYQTFLLVLTEQIAVLVLDFSLSSKYTLPTPYQFFSCPTATMTFGCQQIRNSVGRKKECYFFWFIYLSESRLFFK